MPINAQPFPALPECRGQQWQIADLDELAHLCAVILIGRSAHASEILQGASREEPVISDGQREELRAELFPPAGNQQRVWHRDGLLFEVICWIVARMQATPNEVLSDPHLKATHQGIDGLKIAFDQQTRSLTKATVYEYKCTTYPRNKFQSEVLVAFRDYVSGKRDSQLSQATIALLGPFNLTAEERRQVYQTLIKVRPLAFRAALTVEPGEFPTEACVALFKDYTTIIDPVDLRDGDTLPLLDIRTWFSDFANLVWAKIEAFDV